MPESAGDHPRVIAPTPILFALGLGLGGLAQWVSPWPLAPWHLKGIGVLAVLLGIAISLWAVYTMKGKDTSLDPNRPTTTLIQTGPFAYSRNPIYLAMTISSLGVALYFNSIWLCLSLILTVGVVHYGVILPEEHYLEQKFGKSYARYRQHVRRWI